MRFSGSTAKRAIWLIKWLGNSLVGTASSSKPHNSSNSWPFSLTRKIPKFSLGASQTFLKYFPEPVTIKYFPANFVASNFIGIFRSTCVGFRKGKISSSFNKYEIFPPFRSSQPKRYKFLVVLTISSTNGACNTFIFFILEVPLVC